MYSRIPHKKTNLFHPRKQFTKDEFTINNNLNFLVRRKLFRLRPQSFKQIYIIIKRNKEQRTKHAHKMLSMNRHDNEMENANVRKKKNFLFRSYVHVLVT